MYEVLYWRSEKGLSDGHVTYDAPFGCGHDDSYFLYDLEFERGSDKSHYFLLSDEEVLLYCSMRLS